MFRKLHIQMTAFAALITSAILVVLTLACLAISESGMRKNSYATFENNVNSCISYMEGQTLLSHQWILQAKEAYGIDMKILDNGHELFFNKLNPTEEKADLFQEAAEISRETEGLDVDFPGGFTITKTALFRTEDYYACTALVPKKEGALSAVILYPLDDLKNQLKSQRIAFGMMVCLAIIAMSVFSWFLIKKMLRPLEESKRKQTEFIAAASHELRSPLAVILTSIQAMEDSGEKERERFISTIQSEGSRMARLIGDMLSLANADNHSWSILCSPCELDTLVLDTYEKYEAIFSEKGIRLSAKLPEEAFSLCKCDASRISQVLGILLDNAVSYVPSGGQVCLELAEDEKAFWLTVSDNGPGIPDQDKTSVFERFYRADASRGDKQHFGLGLCIAQEIVTLHRGTIVLTDTPGGGATFQIRLPKE
ncbi:sensor histidine kinase [Ruminococcus sp. 5_1_39BFAA]|uniref:sensor histidine kinase n=1 Tax=Ruminococcus sp. 5_1_39BFAA TaxID=457412 RepID=UPI003562CE1B